MCVSRQVPLAKQIIWFIKKLIFHFTPTAVGKFAPILHELFVTVNLLMCVLAFSSEKRK